jgi:hypothetical protein
MRRKAKMWQPNTPDVEQPIAYKHLLRKACEAVCKKYGAYPLPEAVQTLKDGCGCYGREYGQFIVLAKEKPYGNVVSVHRDALARAMLRKVRILFWLDSANKLYELDPQAVLRNEISENRKGPGLMVNFDVKVLEGIETYKKRAVSKLDPETCMTLDSFNKKKKGGLK